MNTSAPGFVISSPIAGPARGGPRVDISATRVRIGFVILVGRHPEFKTYELLMYEDSSEHTALPSKDLQGWTRGRRYTAAYMDNRKPRNLPTALLRKSEVELIVGIGAFAPHDVSITIEVTPVLDGDAKRMKPVTFVVFLDKTTFIHTATVKLEGELPNDVGEHDLELTWRSKSSGFAFGLGDASAAPEVTRHRIYTIHDIPLKPDHFFESYSDPMKTVDVPKRDPSMPESFIIEIDTLTGTPQRFAQLMAMLREKGQKKAAQASQKAADREEIYWKVHVGINDTPGKPPYFNGARDEHIRPGGKGADSLSVEDQWLAWVDHAAKKDFWNACSCLGHVQLMKTMLAAIGLPVQRTWVLPHTDIAPDGKPFARKYTDADRHIFGDYKKGWKKKALQTTSRDDRGNSIRSHLVLVKPSGEWEDFEACMITPAGKFLTGGFGLSKMKGSGFVAKKGFDSAGELLRWWTTTRDGAFTRFQCWAAKEDGIRHYWDREGNYYDRKHFKQIRAKGKHVPPPAP